MTIRDKLQDEAYRRLALDVFRTAADAVEVETESVEFGAKTAGAEYSWLCWVVDPEAEDRVAPNSGSSAADHFALIDPNGFSRLAGSRIAVTIFELEIADESSISVRGEDGRPKLISPWERHHAVARATFNYRVVSG